MNRLSESETQIVDTLSRCEDIDNAYEYYQHLLTLKQRFTKDPKNHFLAQFLVAMGSEDRLLILDSLRKKDRCVCEIEAILSKSQPTISHHLKILEGARLIQGWKKGKFTHYSLIQAQFNRFLEFFQEWISSSTNWLSTLIRTPNQD